MEGVAIDPEEQEGVREEAVRALVRAHVLVL